MTNESQEHETNLSRNLTINTLPNEILKTIFNLLSIKDKGKTARVCKNWNLLYNSNDTWRAKLQQANIPNVILAADADNQNKNFFNQQNNYYIPVICMEVPKITDVYKLSSKVPENLFITPVHAGQYLLNKQFKAKEFYYVIYVIRMINNELLKYNATFIKNEGLPGYFKLNNDHKELSKVITSKVTLVDVLSLYSKVKKFISPGLTWVLSDPTQINCYTSSKLMKERSATQHKIPQQRLHNSKKDNYKEDKHSSRSCSLV